MQDLREHYHNFNISVGVTDAFMQAVAADADWELRFPDIQHPDYRGFRGGLEDAEARGIPLRVHGKVKARQLFDRIVEQAWSNGEPGMLFLDHAQADHPMPALGRYESTNPCGEQFLMPYENCCLGSINLVRHIGHASDGAPTIDWEAIATTVRASVRFLDDVVTANAYVPAVPQLKEAAHRARRIGLGIMGLADLLFHMHVRYGSVEAQELSAQLMEYIRYHAMLASIDLAVERGPFPAIKGSVFDPEHMTWQPRPWPEWLGGAPSHDWGRPEIEWQRVLGGIAQHGIRLHPTNNRANRDGATVAGIGMAVSRCLRCLHALRSGAAGQIALRYVSPLFERALRRLRSRSHHSGEYPRTGEANRQLPGRAGSCLQELRDMCSWSRAISRPRGTSGCELPFSSSSMPASARQLTFQPPLAQGCGGRLYTRLELGLQGADPSWQQGRAKRGPGDDRDASRRSARSEMRTEGTPQAPAPMTVSPCPPAPVKPVPNRSRASHRVGTPLGTAYVTINTNGQEQPFECS